MFAAIGAFCRHASLLKSTMVRNR